MRQAGERKGAHLRHFFFALALTFLGGASTAHAMQCGNRIVRQGDASPRVRQVCGEPSEINLRVVERSRTIHRQLPDGSVISDTITVAVQLEDWVYDFGPQRFVRVVTFESGEVVDIRTLGYGTVNGRSAPGE
ncbi:MAG: hypothetical protein SangKO_041990 [Sandaracinaceae bacterium]|nr:MAG: DUF2845 domain-containing protein [Sandaracinaceae bacterium]HBQ19857.1 hypothetical protein [Myxococcales bacterium]